MVCDNRRPPTHRDPSVNFEELLAFLGRNQMLSLILAALTVAIVFNEISRLFRGFKALRPAELTVLVNRDNVVTKEQIAHAWTSDGGGLGAGNATEVYIHRLRRRLDRSGLDIRTVRGLGYLLESENKAAPRAG